MDYCLHSTYIMKIFDVECDLNILMIFLFKIRNFENYWILSECNASLTEKFHRQFLLDLFVHDKMTNKRAFSVLYRQISVALYENMAAERFLIC